MEMACVTALLRQSLHYDTFNALLLTKGSSSSVPVLD